MKIPLTIKPKMEGVQAPICQPCCAEKERNPTLCIDIGEDQKDLIQALGTEGTAMIHYEVKRVTVGEDYGGGNGSITLEIESIEPMTQGEDPEEDEEDEEPEEEEPNNATEALDKFMKSQRKKGGGEKPKQSKEEED